MDDAWIPRFEEDLLRKLMAQRPVVVVTGARQTGKTSLVRRVAGGHEYVSLDLPSEAEQAEGAPEAFLRRHPPPVVIDEVQYAPRLLRHLKAAIDKDRKSNGRFVLTGSEKFSLMQGVSESLAGRVGLIELEGLSLRELEEVGRVSDPVAALVRGALPELWEKPEMDCASFYRAYVSTYLERDLRRLLDVGSLRNYERFLRAAALRSAQLLNKADLARDVGISPSTAGAWLSVLEASNQVQLLEPWFGNRNKSLAKSPKLHLHDTGLVCQLVGIERIDDLYDSPLAGPIWETFVASELRKRVRHHRRGDLNFWRDRTREVDFLIHRAGRFELFDAKWAEQPVARDAAGLLRVAAELPRGAVIRKALVCRTSHAYPLAEGVEAIPVSDL